MGWGCQCGDLSCPCAVLNHAGLSSDVPIVLYSTQQTGSPRELHRTPHHDGKRLSDLWTRQVEPCCGASGWLPCLPWGRLIDPGRPEGNIRLKYVPQGGILGDNYGFLTE